MSRTEREYKGTVSRDKTFGRKGRKDKFFGHTSGTHSHKDSDLSPKKALLKTGKSIDGRDGDFMKYGYPNGLYPKHLAKAIRKGYPSKKHKNTIEI